MRVLVLIPYRYGVVPAQRYRIEQWAPLLERRGIHLDFQAFESDELNRIRLMPGQMAKKGALVVAAMAKRLALMRHLDRYDLAVVPREAALVGPPVIERMTARKLPVVFDFDDAIFLPPPNPPNPIMRFLKSPAKTGAIIRMSAHVMAGNTYLADYARSLNRNVTVIPTTIDTDKYVVNRPAADRDPPVIGWTGSLTTIPYLRPMANVFERLAKTDRFRLVIIGGRLDPIPGVDIEHVQWRSDTEVEDVNRLDVGIMPLPDDPWTRGKCGMKALQYMALAIPAVCSPVGVNSDIVQDGVNGFLAESDDEWIEKLQRLIRSAALRRELGARGRVTIEQHYSAQSQIDRIQAVFEDAVASRRKTRS